MIGRLTGSEARQSAPDLKVLEPGDVSSLRLPWDGRFSLPELDRIAEATPRLSVWNRRTGEFLIGGAWRHRREVATIFELGATGGAIVLIDAWADVCRDAGIDLVIVSEQVERRKREFYESAHFELMEEIIVYELARVRAQPPDLGGLHFESFDVENERQFDELLELDHAAFPWLWWNSEQEIRQYAGSPGVSIDLGRDMSGRVVVYTGTTRYRTWGHLDRIAVSPERQGQGLGRAGLDFAAMTLARSGARRVGLSTQARNTRSRTLYEAYGFRRSPGHDYNLFGRWLRPPDAATAGTERTG